MSNAVKNKKKLVLIAVVALAVICAACFFVFGRGNPDKGNPGEELKEKAQLYADSMIQGDYDTVIDMQYYLPERKYMLDEFEQILKTEGMGVTGYRFVGVEKLSKNLYQLEGRFTYGSDESEFYPFYFFMDNKWNFAVTTYHVPARFLENVEYKKKKNVLDPDGLTIW